MQKKKAQASLEYLMTYGWALILVATVIGVLVFIVSSPSSSIVFNSSNPTKIMLKAGSVTGNNATMVLQNITGGKINITSAGECNLEEGPLPLEIHGGGQFTLNCPVSNGSIGNVSVQYTDYAGLDRTVDISSSGTGGGPSGPTGYTAYYKFDEGSETATSDSAGTNNGTLVGFANPDAGNPDSGWVSGGISGKTLSFDGVDDHIQLAINDGFDFGQGNFSISFWANVHDVDNATWGGKIIKIHDCDGTTAHITISINQIGPFSKTSFVYMGKDDTFPAGPIQFSTNTDSINLNQWHHVVFTIDRTGENKGKSYVDGIIQTQSQDLTSWTGNINCNNNTYARIANHAGPNHMLDGTIDELKIYNRALTASEACDLCNLHGSCSC